MTLDHADALYRCGETITFQIQGTSGIAPDAEVRWRISKDGALPIQSGIVRLTARTGQVRAQLNEPGFLICCATVVVVGEVFTAEAGAGIEPLKIRPSLPEPEDFEVFWEEQKRRLAAVPMSARLTRISDLKGNVEVFDVQVDALGAPASGYFARPINARTKSLPVILLLHGAGVASADSVRVTSWAEEGMLAMDLNAHGIDNGQSNKFYEELADGALKDYPIAGRDSRETCYFLGMFLRGLRALDFLCSQPEWDGKTMIVYGGSQGGFQAFAAAALDERVTFLAAAVPAGCDHSGMVAGRIAGWPKIVPVTDGEPDAKVLTTARYFDNVNFAAHIKAREAILTVGFFDPLCPPTTVYAAFNELPVLDKKIYNDIQSDHVITPMAEASMINAVRSHVLATRSITGL